MKSSDADDKDVEKREEDVENIDEEEDVEIIKNVTLSGEKRRLWLSMIQWLMIMTVSVIIVSAGCADVYSDH